ncbi:MAG: PH domain-containing protein [Candidatus Bathyarchaeota archaeon]|nr:PH domain-containing protein [Candidatus Bathyarchaeota archaeon]
MTKNTQEKVIRPPKQQITSGTIFKPSKAYLHKMQTQNILAFIIIYLSVVLSFLAIAYMGAGEPGNLSATQTINQYFLPVNLWTVGLNLIWLLPTLALTPIYFRSIEYSVKAESGDTMPEIYSKRGIFTITRRHVPFRTITNISSQAGPFDRIFKIGSVHIETAGYSGASQKGPEENLAGIVFYEEVRDFILLELRKFKEPYTTGTEVVYPTEKPVPSMEGLDDEILVTLREIRDLLKQR